MTRESLLLKVRQAAADLFGLPVEAITPASSPETVSNWDSLQQLNLVLTLEQAFNITFLPEDIVQFLNIELIAIVIEEKLAGLKSGEAA
jgi:acyl carrier protein